VTEKRPSSRQYARPEREWLLRAYRCWRKRPRDEGDAAQFIEAEQHKSTGVLVAYPCQYGDHFHVGRQGAATSPVKEWLAAKHWWRKVATEDCTCGSGLTTEECALGPDVRPRRKGSSASGGAA
jgi:hypothetical protein